MAHDKEITGGSATHDLPELGHKVAVECEGAVAADRGETFRSQFA